ncbi:SIR2 family NAD-dependent protein deacylase [Polyangium jinanense]|uniref:SIR2 family NAD-dependent protein deacylase n=1 Tax=Polyangium jinanense TaxID=2829994 RepID=UPI002340E88F|nr:SIR2 family protein [Polyangium jinanense]
MASNIPWKRFWVPRETSPSLWSDYFADPEGEYGKHINPHAKTLEELEDKPCVALLGEPGIGKSYVVEEYRDHVRARGGVEATLFVDFRWQHDKLEKEIFGTDPFKRWLANASPLTLILDSLDEHPKGPLHVASQLIHHLQQGSASSLRLRVACRSAEWPAVLDEQLPRIWKSSEQSEPAVFYALAPLRRVDVALAAGKDGERFLGEVARANAEPLASKPITLGFLLAEYQQHRKLPRSRVELYEEGCRRLCEDPSPSRGDARRTGVLHRDERLALASRIAAVSILGRRSLIHFRGPDRGAVSSDVVRIDELLGGVEPSQDGDVPVTDAAMKEVLNSGLFRPGGAGRAGWAHQTYAEFLAARFLKMRGLTAEQLVREVSNSTMGRTVPALRETIAWLASMDGDFRQRLLGIDPEPLLGSDFAMVGAAEREALLRALLEKIDRREMRADPIMYDRRAQAHLVHPRLAEQLRPYITDRNHYVMARRAAIQMAEAGCVAALQDELADLALDVSEDYGIRSDAADAVVRVGSRETKRRLKPLIGGNCGPDPDDKLKGSALEALWADDLSAAELFASLTPPKRESYSGTYVAFLHRLEDTLPAALLPDALHWTLGLPPRHGDDLSYAFESLSEAIMVRGWEHIDDPQVRPAFAQAVRERLLHYEGIFGHRPYHKGDAPDVSNDDRRRRLLASALNSLPPWGEHDASVFVSDGFVLPRDVPWVIEQLRTETAPSIRVRWAAILAQFTSTRMWSFEVADPIIGAILEMEELRQAMPDIPPLVVLGSPTSRWMRRAYRQDAKVRGRYRRMFAGRSSRKRRERPKALRRIRECMRRFEAGEDDAGWQLLGWMTVGTVGESDAGTYEWDVTNFPGWKRADAETRDRILDIGRAYLLRTNERADEWLGLDGFHRPAAAGYRYLCLLHQLDPAWLDQHSEAIWRRWSAIPLEFFLQGGGYEQNRQIVARAYRARPVRVLEVLGIHLERDHERWDHVSVLSRMSGCWDQTLGQFLFKFVQRTELKASFFGHLLNELIAHDVDGVVDYAASILTLPVPLEGAARLRMHAAAHALMVYAQNAGWPAIRPLLRADPSFGREVFLTAVDAIDIRLRRSDAWGRKLTTADIAELYTWLEHEFPEDEGAEHRSRGLHPITPRDMVVELRNGLLNVLISRGTPEAVAALEQIQVTFPQRDWTRVILLAKEAAAQGTWTPRSPREIVQLRPTPVRATSPTMSSTPTVAHGVVFPPPLIEAYRQNKLAVLFGSGLSLAKDVKGNFPKWSELPDRLLDQVERLGVWLPDQVAAMRTFFRSGHRSLETMLSALDTARTELRNARQYQAAMDAVFRPPDATPADVHRALVELGVCVLATTNYDSLVEHLEGPPRRTAYTWKEAENAYSDIITGRNVLFKIHGTAEKADTVVMTQAEYTIAAGALSYQRIMSFLLQDYTFLLVGYGINDPLDLDLVFELNVRSFGIAARRHYALIREPASDRDRWSRDFNVQVVAYQDHDDLPAILRSLQAAKP